MAFASRSLAEMATDIFFDQYHRSKFGIDKRMKKNYSHLRYGSCIFIHGKGEREEVKTSEVPEKEEGNIRLVFISDIHSTMNSLDETNVPDGDVLIIAGDLAMTSIRFSDGYCYRHYSEFNKWLERLPHSEKLIIGGNHDGYLEKIGVEEARKLLSAGTYLEDSGVELFGLKFWGSPVSWGSSPNRAFQSDPESRLAKIEKCDVLITHEPCSHYTPELCAVVEDMKPMVHVAGHVHYLYGSQYKDGTMYINASSLDNKYSPINLTQVMDIPSG
mmetsp:Transcript_16076/g.19526  ORF Transcript_16076/g.19526 Transcript_16076/m.19526 type:complete len:273 (+) Transcript_16076:152-970(+)